ncbi:peptidoglycan DD-metalloendopeptidase family protein [Chitinimonas sp. BJYL2]|uniref:peptidoglycan DD-metalloendopeptidase family protein n=1 Tax=Chitinimonas sp. BJYL2 TaxID=2976696 RepID=UPI0022B2D395|nr:peptidoglycan DD-metalloendopeptidase family protein [Chitinimonas sp. BJYL2]
MADVPGKSYTVKPGDTLYSIALENGSDYKEIAAWNQLADVNLIKVGQVLRLTDPADDPAPAEPPSGVVIRPLKLDGGAAPAPVDAQPAPVVANAAFPKALKFPYGTDAASVARQSEGAATSVVKPAEVPPAEKPELKPEAKPADTKPVNPATGEEEISWSWPTVGRVIGPFSESSKGIDIAGKLGQPVLAAGGGKVVYAGTGLRGYGKLIIIKHNKTYLTAYAHNSQLLVKEGATVKKGDKIAEMGNSDADQIKLHFEIRRFGKPVDPTKYLTAGSP